MYYRTSKKYREKLKKVKINNVTIKIENGKYYAVFNIETEIPEFPKTNKFVGIDLGMRTLATLDNGLKIANLDVTHEENMIKKYQKRLSRQKNNSNRYKKTLKTYWKWIDQKPTLQPKITKNRMEKICRNDQIQSRNIRKNTKTNKQMVPIK